MKKTLTLLLTTFISGFGALAQPDAEICLVTVDTSFTHNVVVWEKPIPSTVPVDSIRIYRVVGGNPVFLDAVDYDSLSEYHDYAADPNLMSYSYAIQAVDDNGDAGAISAAHSTIHFSVLDDGSGDLTLVWTSYVGHPVTTYECWRDSLNVNDLEHVNTASGTDTHWTDGQPPLNWTNLHYMVDVVWSVSCVSTRANHNTTRSNKTQPIAGGLSNNDLPTLTAFNMFPNPAANSVNIAFSSLTWENTTIGVYDLNGRLVVSFPTIKVKGQYRFDLDTGELTNGMYVVRISNGQDQINERLLITK